MYSYPTSLQRLGFTSLCLLPAWEITKGAFHLSVTDWPDHSHCNSRISLLIKLFSQMLNTVNSCSSGHCRDLKLVSSLLRVGYSEKFNVAKCNLGKVKLQASGQRSPPQAYVICGVMAGPIAYLVTYVASHAGIFELIYADLLFKRIFADSGSRPISPL